MVLINWALGRMNEIWTETHLNKLDSERAFTFGENNCTTLNRRTPIAAQREDTHRHHPSRELQSCIHAFSKFWQIFLMSSAAAETITSMYQHHSVRMVGKWFTWEKTIWWFTRWWPVWAVGCLYTIMIHQTERIKTSRKSLHAISPVAAAVALFTQC